MFRFILLSVALCADCMQDQYDGMFTMIHAVMSELIEFRRRLLSAALTQGQMAELKSKIASKIDWGNKYVFFTFRPFLYNVDISVVAEVALRSSVCFVTLFKMMQLLLWLAAYGMVSYSATFCKKRVPCVDIYGNMLGT